MKNLILLGLLGTAIWATDFSQMSTEELVNMRGSINPTERAAFQAEMQKRMQTMSVSQRQQFGQGQGMRKGRGQGMGKGMRGQGRGMSRGNRGAQNRPTFALYDLNGDGKIIQDEFYKAQAARMTQKANEGRQMRNAANAPTFESIDSNGDQIITPDEFSAHQMNRMNNNSRGKRF